MRAGMIVATGFLLGVTGCGEPAPVDTAAQQRVIDKVLHQTVKGSEYTLQECLAISGGWDVNPDRIKPTTIEWPRAGNQAWRVSLPSEGTVDVKYLRFGVDLATGQTLPMSDEDVAALTAAGCRV